MKLKLTDEQKKILSQAGKIYSQMAHASMTKEQRIARAKKASHARRGVDKSMDKN